ncbi:unnamed protein product [Clonostachys rhizophaga]|uniref:Uncharacterized protein n=1 Tax=Clonostachys rhizophaga TaxID=160324 RepID=A0A9N9VDF2_9HYPO|nr:unnamed protein product [Clonostachys rhizophaga]
MTARRQETELPLLHNGGRQDRPNRQRPRRLASSRPFPAQTTQNFANSDVDHSRTTPWSVDRDQEGSVLDGYTTETSSSTQTMVIPSTRPNDASNNTRSKLLRHKEVPVRLDGGGSEKWQPFWLRPTVLGTFSALFLCYAIALPVLLSFSHRNNGLLEARRDLEQLWRFGPTAVFTLVTILWSRVELQTLRYFPWVQSQTSNDSSIYMLDYTSKISITILIQSLRKKHFLVFIITLTTLLLKVQVVLIPSLFSLKTVQVSKPVPVQIWDFFDPEFSHRNFGEGYKTGYWNFRAIQDFNTGIPFGVGNNSIYQTFAQANTTNATRGTIDSPLTTIVDGLFFDVECRQVESCTPVYSYYSDTSQPQVSVDLKFEGCPQASRTRVYNAFSPLYWHNKTSLDDRLSSNSPADHCSQLPNQFNHSIYLASRWVPSPENSSIPILNACAGVICSPTAWIAKTEVRDDGNHPKMTLLPDQEKTPIKTNPFELIENSVPDALGGNTSSPLMINSFLLESTDVEKKYPDGFPLSLYTNQVMYDSVLTLNQALGPLVAHHELRNKTERQTTGSRPFEVDRLQLNRPICICLAVISALSAFVSVWAILQYKGAFKNWHRNPATILGLMSFSDGQRLEPSSEQKETRIKSWRQHQESPLPLPTWLRLITTIYVLGLIISLVTVLQLSNASNGILTLKEGTLSLWWTAGPTLAIYLVTLYTTSSDTVVRDLAIHAKLGVRSCTVRELDISLLDMLGLRALYYSVRWKIHTVTLTQLLAIACGFLASLSSLLFFPSNFPGSFDVNIKQQSWFGSRALAPENGGKMSEYNIARWALNGLMITQTKSNFTWPDFTYRDLIFPRLEIDGPSQDWNSSVSFELEAPAIKLMPECTQLPQDVLIRNPTHYSWDFYYTANLTHTCPNGTKFTMEYWNSVYPVQYDSYMLAELEPRVDPCPTDLWMEKTYFWGKRLNYTFGHTAVWRCNYTWAEVPTKLNMLWAEKGLQVDHQRPPSPDYSKAKPLYPSFSTPTFGGDEIDTFWPKTTFSYDQEGIVEWLDTRYHYLFQPTGSLDVTRIGDPDYDQTLLEAIHSSYALIAGQLANALNRLNIDEASTSSPSHSEELPLISATATDKRQRRLFQKADMTYLIVGILSLCFLINTWALVSSGLKRFINYRGKFFLDLEMKDLVPPDYNSIAMATSLLSPSNYSKYLDSGDEQGPGMLGLRFRMGWFIRKGGQERELTIGVLNDPDFQFLGGKQSNG